MPEHPAGKAVLVAMLVLAAVAGRPALAVQADDWQLEKVADRCTLQRRLPGPPPAAVSITTDPGSDDYQLTLAGTDLPKPSHRTFPAMVVLGTGRELPGKAMYGQLGGAFPQAFQVHGLDPKGMAELGRASAVGLRFQTGAIGPFPVADLGEAVAAFEQCTAEHLVAMGADASQFLPGGTRPVPATRRETWLGFRQVGELMKAGGPTAMAAKFRLVIDGEGRLDTCSRVGAAPNDPLEKPACAVFRSIRFSPARDPAGRGVRGVATVAMTQMIVMPGR